jgi:hypothetical protein
MDGPDSKFLQGKMKGDTFMEVVADPKTGAIAKADKITDADDLKAATSQKAAMAEAKMSLFVATETRSRLYRLAGGQHRSAAAERSCAGRSDLPARNGVQEGDGEARLIARTRLDISREDDHEVLSAIRACRPSERSFRSLACRR